jgi:phage-related protein (TIGR01555 family)
MGSEIAKVIPIFSDRMRRVARSDGFTNLVTGLGTARDKMFYNRFVRGARLDTETLDALYSENDMASRICDVVPEEELRKGFDVIIAPDAETKTGEDIAKASEAAQAVQDEAKRLDVAGKVTDARVWGRVFGGGALILGVDDGATVENGGLAQPLNEKAIKSFDHINVVDRRYLHPLKYYTDPMSAKVGLPETYLVTPQATDSISAARMAGLGTTEVHETRLVVFGGTRTTIRTRQENSGWDTSVLQRVNTVLTQFGVSWDALAHMLQDASQGVFKMQGFLDALGAEETSLIMQRLDVMDMARSAMRALVLDADGEEFTRQNYSWSGIKDPYEMMILRTAAAARMPVTILMGQSPAGMNATGESDIRWFYDTIQSSQTNVIEPALRRILTLIMLSKSGPTRGQLPASWSINFPSLWQMTPEQEADIYKTTAEADAIYINAGVATSEEIAVSRFTPDGYKTTTQINLEERLAVLEADLDDDIENTPTLDDPDEMTGEVVDDVAATALNGAQTTALVDVATKVQNGELDQASGVAIVLAANPALNEAEARAIVGEEDPERAAARAKAVSALPAQPPPTPPGDEGDDEDEDEDEDEDADDE